MGPIQKLSIIPLLPARKIMNEESWCSHLGIKVCYFIKTFNNHAHTELHQFFNNFKFVILLYMILFLRFFGFDYYTKMKNGKHEMVHELVMFCCLSQSKLIVIHNVFWSLFDIWCYTWRKVNQVVYQFNCLVLTSMACFHQFSTFC